MAIEADAAARAVSETAPMSPDAEAAAAGPARPARPRRWLRKLILRAYHLPWSSRRWRLATPSAASASRLASSLSHVVDARGTLVILGAMER